MKTIPEVSVVMSVHNGASDLVMTMDSILSQDGARFEFIVINDGSTDQSGEILNYYAKRDSRVRVIHQEKVGLTRALIRGCDAAKAALIARQDAGDISVAGRLRNQMNFLKAHENCVLVSCW